MAWDHLSINKPHLVYIILGGFTSLFMLCSSIIKEKLYIGEATVATLCGIIFGPHAANLIDPSTWGNEDQITLEFARIVLVVQCFAVGVELPKAYMERHWRSVTLLLIPVMTFGWLITSLFMWALVPSLNWLDSLCVAACVTATDPVLASSVVGKGKFAKRVPKHLRDLLSAESGCNDGMAFPFIYLALYIIKYRHEPNEVALNWIVITVLYECVFGAFYGFMVGYIARRLIRAAHERDLIDRESFLVFYFVLALFCAGSGSILGVDDLLVGFACGVGFSNDGWFTEKTEESHVSNVIDLLINLAFFVYFGTIIPWNQYNSSIIGLDAWRLVVIGLLVLFFRRIPIMLVLKPIIPDIKTWREALFAGHFGPIGVGGLFVAILARAELETGGTTPLAELPPADFEHDNIIELIWPITTFLVICSIVVHGSSIAVFTLGKRINTLTLTMSYTQASEDSPNWMDRLPRIQSRSRSSMARGDDTESSFDEKTGSFLPSNFLRRQREDDEPHRAANRRRSRKSYGGPISQSAIAPQRHDNDGERPASRPRADSEAETDKPKRRPMAAGNEEQDDPDEPGEEEGEIYEEGDKTVYEDEEGNVLAVEDSRRGESDEQRQLRERDEGHRLMKEHDVHHGVAWDKDDPHVDEGDKLKDHLEDLGDGLAHPQKEWRKMMKGHFGGLHKKEDHSEKPTKHKPTAKPEAKRGPARAYQFGNTIIVEDEDGEVLKKYDIPAPPRKTKVGADGETVEATPGKTRQTLQRMGTFGRPGHKAQQAQAEAGPSNAGKPTVEAETKRKKRQAEEDADDARLRFTVGAGGRRMSKAEFIQQISALDPKARAKFVEQSDVPEGLKAQAREDASMGRRPSAQQLASHVRRNMPELNGVERVDEGPEDREAAAVKKVNSNDSVAAGPEGLTLIDSNEDGIPFHDANASSETIPSHNVVGDLRNRETAAERRRREARTRAQQCRRSPSPPAAQEPEVEDSEDDGTERIPPPQRSTGSTITPNRRAGQSDNEGETAAERRRREGALGVSKEESDSDEDESAPRQVPQSIRFAEPQRTETAERPHTGRLRWGTNRRG
ncbi:Sodium/hydrogen exchanger family-domain-containing protein [Delphinella strobiligena]|nr:Sodium/hydrogen exchanger family-domain-containing protein [Delphinella strobiligena]